MFSPKPFRKGNYSHIKGIGVANQFNCRFVSQGFVGQTDARKAAKLSIKLFQEQQFEGGGIIITGSGGSGKTSLAWALSLSIDINTLFITVSGSEIYSPSLSKLEYLTQLTRRSIGITFFQETILITGEVVGYEFSKDSFQKSIQLPGKITIKTNDVQSVYDIGPKILKRIIENNIKPGDFITIDRVNGQIKKKKEFELYTGKKIFQNMKKDTSSYLELENHVILEHFVTLHELDILNHFDNLFSNFFSKIGTEIPNEVRETIDKIILSWTKDGKVKFTRGILFIDDIHILDSECLSFLGKKFESILSPFFICATDNSKTKVTGLKLLSFHGMPLDFLDRLLMVPLKPNSEKEIRKILKLRSEENSIPIEGKALNLLTRISLECGVRYSLYLMTTSIIINPNNLKKLDVLRIKKSYSLFVDCKRLTRFSNVLKKSFLGFK
mmetsp:Transcript_39352/g.80608  ORF Transcript_39352/g.80608 Transcript_39352/m.80608 type:complete len:440 (+) Transcript_39352:1583-2902(+)